MVVPFFSYLTYGTTYDIKAWHTMCLYEYNTWYAICQVTLKDNFLFRHAFIFSPLVLEWVQEVKQMTIGKTIRALRKEKGITQKKLSELTGIATITIQEYEADKYVPQLKRIERIAAALGVSPFEIMGAEYWDLTSNNQQLVNAVAAFEAVDSAYGEEATKILNDFLTLNDTGKRKAAEYIADLTEQPKYTK